MGSAMEFSTGKTVLILSLVIGCFAVLWPKIFYPMLQASISSAGEAPYTQEYAPQERPSGPHPGLRDVPHAAAAAAHAQVQNMARQPRRPNMDRMARAGGPQIRAGMPGGYGGYVQPQKGSGAMGIIMPIYTVGIVIFFMYTIMRVMFRKQPEKEKSRGEARPPPGYGGYRIQPPDLPDGRHAAHRPASVPRHEQRAEQRAENRAEHRAEHRAENRTEQRAEQRTEKTEPEVERRVEARRAAATQRAAPPPVSATPLPMPPPASATMNGVPARDKAAGRLAPTKSEEAEIDQLRRRLEETERAMERIMKQMSTVSQKLNVAKINSNIRALKQELWGSMDSLASDSLASDYSLSLDSRGQVLTDYSWRTYSLDTSAAAPYSLENAASAVSRLARSVSQLSLEMETAAGDDGSLPAETGAELSELDADFIDGVDELRHDGANAVRRFESLEALQNSRGKGERAGEAGEQGEGKGNGVQKCPPPLAESYPFEPRPAEEGEGEEGPRTPATISPAPRTPTPAGVGGAEGTVSPARSPTPTPAVAAPGTMSPGNRTPTPGGTTSPTPGQAVGTTSPTPGQAGGTTSPTPGQTPQARATLSPEPHHVTAEPRSHPSAGSSSPSAALSAPLSAHSHSPHQCGAHSEQLCGRCDPRAAPTDAARPHVIVLGLRTKRTPEREPRSVTFRLGGDPGRVMASCRVDAEGLPPQSAVLIRETETRAGRGDQSDDAPLQTKLELEIRGMEALAAPPRAAWAHRLPPAAETSLASIEGDLDKASKALKNVTAREAAGAPDGKDKTKVPPSPESVPADGSGVQRVHELRES